MSDALLTEISKKLGDIHAALTKGGGGAATPGATSRPAATGATAPGGDNKAVIDAKAKARATAEAAAKVAAGKTGGGAPASGGPAGSTKAKGGKHTLDQVREMIRKVAADVGRQDAKDILLDDGGGVERCDALKPEKYDAVFEACQVLLRGEGGQTATAAEPEDEFG
jgi:hypothetical protein